jgi:hypothetical protein
MFQRSVQVWQPSLASKTFATLLVPNALPDGSLYEVFLALRHCPSG